MADSKELLRESKREFSLADNIAIVAVPVVKDRNVFLSVLEHADKSIYLAMRSYLIKQKELKKLRMIPESEELSRQLFFEECADPLSITTSECHILTELNQLVRAHKKSYTEIKRGGDYIIFLPNFETVSVNETNVKRYLSTARVFINKIERGT